MLTLREGIEKAQFQTPPNTSLRAVAARFGLQPPISILRVAQLLVPETADWDTGSVVSGDDELVTAHGHLRLGSTGFWKFTGEVDDSGDGATFAIVMKPKFVDSSGKSLLFGEADELSDDETTSFSKEGRDLWIARNWDAIRNQGFTWNLKAETGVDIGAVFAGAIFPLAIFAVAAWGASKCNEKGTWTTEKSDGNTTATCQHS